MPLTNELVQEMLVSKFGDQVTAFSTETGMLSFEAPAANNLKVLQYLNEDPALGFTFLTDICAVNYPDNNGSELVVVYHLHNLLGNM